MITRNLTLTITDKSVSLDKAIILYQYDRGVTFNFKLVSSDYTFNEEEITKARTIIKRPNKDISVSEIDDILDGVYTFHLDGSYTNDAFEIGIYTMQLQLYSNSDECITVAPFTFEVKSLIGLPPDDAAYVGYSTVGNSSARGSDALDTGDLANGEYLETVWVDKDLITSGRLNKIETVLDYLVEDAANNSGTSGPIADLEVLNSINMGRIGDVGTKSIALGTDCKTGNNASAIGYGLIANPNVIHKGQCVVGRYNEEEKTAVFIVGNGTDDARRSNALVITKGNIYMNKPLSATGGIDADSFMVYGNPNEGDISHIRMDNNGILIKSKERKIDEEGNEIYAPEEEYVATKEYVNDAIANIEIPEADLSNYATKEDLQTALGDIDSILGGI
jgi:hypothetical protein